MSKYIFLKDSNGQLYKFLADDTGLMLQQSTNGDPETFGDLQTSMDLTDYDGWMRDQVALMHTLAPALTNFREVKPGEYPLPSGGVGAPGALRAVAVGGGVTNEALKNTPLTYASIYQTHATTSWAMAFRGYILPSTAGHFNLLGMVNDGNDNQVGAVAYSTASATKYVLYTYDGQEEFEVSTVDADTAVHDFVVAFDGTTLYLYIDGVEAATNTDLSGLTSDTMWPVCYGTVQGEATALRFAYGYIAP